MIDAIETCGSTPEEFFSSDIGEFNEIKEISERYRKLSDESKNTIKDLMKNMK